MTNNIINAYYKTWIILKTSIQCVNLDEAMYMTYLTSDLCPYCPQPWLSKGGFIRTEESLLHLLDFKGVLKYFKLKSTT